MPSSFFKSVFDSDPTEPEELAYSVPDYVKQEEPSGFTDFLVPLPSPDEKSLESLDMYPKLDTAMLRTNMSDTSNFSASPLLSPDAHDSGSSPDESLSSFGPGSRTEVDDVFIHQISRFSDLSPVRNIMTSSHDVVNVPSPSCQLPPESVVASIPHGSATENNTSDKSNRQSSQIPSHNSHTPTSDCRADAETRVGCTAPIVYHGHVINITGWEPSGSDTGLPLDIDLKNWLPTSLRPVTNKQVLDDSRDQTQSSCSASSSERRPTPVSQDARQSWGRRAASNCSLPEGRKKRRDGSAVPYERGSVKYALAVARGLSLNNDPNSRRENECIAGNTRRVQARYALDRGKPEARLSVPAYVFPQPDIARAITRSAAEEERKRSVEVNIRLLESREREDETEETRKLVDEFLDIPDDTKAQIVGYGDGREKGNVLLKAFNPSRFPSAVPDANSVERRGLRAARSLIEYSASTRRRALTRSRSEAQSHVIPPPAKKISEGHKLEGRAFLEHYGAFSVANGIVNLDTFPPMKRLLDQELAVPRSAKRVRAS